MVTSKKQRFKFYYGKLSLDTKTKSFKTYAYFKRYVHSVFNIERFQVYYYGPVKGISSGVYTIKHNDLVLGYTDKDPTKFIL